METLETSQVDQNSDLTNRILGNPEIRERLKRGLEWFRPPSAQSKDNITKGGFKSALRDETVRIEDKKERDFTLRLSAFLVRASSSSSSFAIF